MSKDGIEDDGRLAPDGSGADADNVAGGALDPAGPADVDPRAYPSAPSAEDILTDPETVAPDALDIEAEIEEAELAEGIEPGTSDADVAGASDDDTASLSDEDLEKFGASELAVATVAAGGSSSRRRAGSSAVTPKKDAPTRTRDVPERESPIARLGRFLREVVAELRKVIWPSRKQMITYTIVVIVFLVIMVALVSGLDVLFHLIVGKVLG